MTTDFHDDFLCIANAKYIHHIDYLMPFVERSKERKLFLFSDTPDYIRDYCQRFPYTSLKYFPTNKQLVKILKNDPEICSKKMIFNCVLNAEIGNFLLNPYFYHVHLSHGVRQKYVNSKMLEWFWLFDTSILFSKKDLLQILHHKGIQTTDLKDQKTIMIRYGNRDYLFIIGGNLRVRDYLSHHPTRKQIFSKYSHLDSNKKTILYMPSHTSYELNEDRNLCTIEYFTKKLIPKFKSYRDYNLIIKCHPNTREDKKELKALLKLQKKHPNIHICYTGNYLNYMQISDLLIGDFSSSTYDFLYFNKPILFIDKFDEVPSPPSIEDINSQYWLFGAGPIITPKKIDQVISDELEHDSYKKIRKQYKEMSFDDTLSAEEILNHCRKHPKYER